MANYFDTLLNATNSETIVLNVGKDHRQKQVNAPKDLLSMKSETMAKLVHKCDGTLDLSDESPIAVTMFVGWCYQDRLQPLPDSAPLVERKKHKCALMDLWLFSARFDIPKLQNETMRELLSLLDEQQLLEPEADVAYAWNFSPPTTDGMKWLVVYALVARIEQGNSNIGDFERLAGFPGFFPKMYGALREWDTCETPKNPKKGKGKTKWSVFCRTEEIQDAVMVKEEVKPKPRATPQKRSAQQYGAGDSGSSAKKAKWTGFTPGEVIELD